MIKVVSDCHKDEHNHKHCEYVVLNDDCEDYDDIFWWLMVLFVLLLILIIIPVVFVLYARNSGRSQ